MVELFERSKVEKIEKVGDRILQRQEKVKIKIDKLINRKDSAKSYLGYLKGCLAVARNDKNVEMSALFEDLINKYMEFEKTRVEVRLSNWKNKSSIKVIKHPEFIDIITYIRPDQDSEPIETKTQILKEEINGLIMSFNLFDKEEKILTRYLAKEYCSFMGIHKNNRDKELFMDDVFDWQSFFADRKMHTKFNLMLRLLDFLRITKYRGGKSQIISEKIDINEVFK